MVVVFRKQKSGCRVQKAKGERIKNSIHAHLSTNEVIGKDKFNYIHHLTSNAHQYKLNSRDIEFKLPHPDFTDDNMLVVWKSNTIRNSKAAKHEIHSRNATTNSNIKT